METSVGLGEGRQWNTLYFLQKNEEWELLDPQPPEASLFI